MTADYVTFHAARRPAAVAIIDNGREITYEAFARDIRKFTRALRELGLGRGAGVAIGCNNLYLNWLLRIAFERLCVVTETLVLDDNARPAPFMPVFELVMSDGEVRAGGAGRFLRITPSWAQGILDGSEQDDEPAPSRQPDDPLYVLQTSGTTGTPKRLLVTRAIHERRVARLIWLKGLTPQSRYLLAVPSATRSHAACIRAGATVVIERRMPLAQAILTHAITHMTLPPIALKQILEQLPARFVRPAELAMFSFGAAISGALRDKALARLASDVCDLYGSNEAGFISATRAGAEAGAILPGAHVEIVDDRDRPLPLGETGWIRARTDYMAASYLDDPEATRQVFRGGWVHTRDLGVLHERRRLQVIGRGDDVLNIGWKKIAPEVLEQRVLKFAAVEDVGVSAIRTPDRIDQICVAVSGACGSDQEILEQVTRALADLQTGGFYLFKLDRIPRNANGKIQRRLIRDAAAARMRAR